MCPPGQTRRDDTRGHCCWPSQAWSIAAAKCVGAPRCPDGMVARRNQCIAAAGTASLHSTTRGPGGEAGSATASAAPTLATDDAPSFHLGAPTYAAGEDIAIRFTAPVSSTEDRRAWITVIGADQPPSAYGAWSYLDNGATSATLKAPAKPGAYEVRLHTDYPARTFNVRRTVPVMVAPEAAPQLTPPSAQRFTVASAKLSPGAKLNVAFATALHAAPNEQFWITIVDAGAGEATWGAYDYVPPGARRMQLTAPSKPGDYEVRLHANYPTKSTNLVHRVAIRVE
jgi:hypothetical protein